MGGKVFYEFALMIKEIDENKLPIITKTPKVV